MRLPLLALLFAVPAVAADRETAPQPRPLELAVIESSLPTAGGRIRQFAFDNDPKTYFASKDSAKSDDHLTLTFDRPIALKSVSVLSGKPNGEESLSAGAVEVSTDGKKFEEVAKFAAGTAKAAGTWKGIVAVRVRATADLTHPLVVRDIAVDSDPAVLAFRRPIEFTLDVADAPEMKPWADKVVRICEREFPRICDFLASDGFTPPTLLHMALKSDYKGVAEAGGGRIKGSVKFFKDHPEDIGAMIHETVHCVQNYRGRNFPGWLVEGVADYYRFWLYEPGKAGRLAPERAKYDGSYRTTAAFLAYVTAKHDTQLVPKLNAIMREGKYDVGVWKKLTGKTVEELDREWRESLTK